MHCDSVCCSFCAFFFVLHSAACYSPLAPCSPLSPHLSCYHYRVIHHHHHSARPSPSTTLLALRPRDCQTTSHHALLAYISPCIYSPRLPAPSAASFPLVRVHGYPTTPAASMRPLRLLVSLATSLVACTLVLYMVLGAFKDDGQRQMASAAPKGGFKALFSFASPGSLFPPSAIISLTDDNSTFFLARPAAFGPSLPKDGLSGPLWVGSGFGDDSMGAGGELGCSDVPGWHDGSDELMATSRPAGGSKTKSKHLGLGRDATPKEGVHGGGEHASRHVSADDGTDDHLQPRGSNARTQSRRVHADIQSLQESAEITGKIVLLKRGGCGFLAKVQWAQSRGGKAVVVGDDVRGGALVRMYAKGDTSNITIPSLFTSHTTAHLLSSLMPDDSALARTVKNFSPPSRNAAKSYKTPGYRKEYGHGTSTKTSHPGFLHSFLAFFGLVQTEDVLKAGSRRLPNSGDLEWVEMDGWDDDEKPIRTKTMVPASTQTRISDGFVIGEQDWRDPDLLPLPTPTSEAQKAASTTPMPVIPDGNSSLGSSGYSDTHGRRKELWVTLTPTNVSSSPFFDTLLVLVVSPLVTLTVVYVLLLLRSRIRRRRWRAPKSVVERLPVRTYQTINDSPPSSAVTLTAASPTTPLLQHCPPRSRSADSGSRSSTDSDVPGASTSTQTHTRDREEEKRESGLAAWRRRYGGRQRECVVCLEEYVDGVSQVMSLPCGHEFHADCM